MPAQRAVYVFPKQNTIKNTKNVYYPSTGKPNRANHNK